MRCDNLFLWYLGEDAPCYVGALSLVAAGKGVSLHYGPEWLSEGFPLSEDLPLEDVVFLPAGRLESKHPRAAGAVDDARPDRWGEKVIRFIDKPDRLSLMEYLYYAGDDRFGALGVSTSATEYIPKGRGPLPRLEDAQTLSEVVAKVQEGESLTDIESQIIAGGGTPLGGAKPKALIVIDGEQWVIKFFNGEPVDSPLVEHASMTLAAKAGINVAQTNVISVDGLNAIVIRRFDRKGDKRVHCISAGTAIRASTASGQDPEMGYPELARILRRAGVSENDVNASDARELFKRMVFNILIGNHDNHLKNISLMVSAEGVSLAKTYDLLSTAVYHTEAFPMEGAKWPEVDLAIPLPNQQRFANVTRAGVIAAGATLGLPAQICEREIDSITTRVGPELDTIIASVEHDNAQLPADTRQYLGGELRLLRAIRHIIVAQMLQKISHGPSSGSVTA